jgi:hypothetical protein
MREHRAPYFEHTRAKTPNARNHSIPSAICYLPQLLVCRAVLLNQNPAAVYLVSLRAGLRRTLQPASYRISDLPSVAKDTPDIGFLWSLGRACATSARTV